MTTEKAQVRPNVPTAHIIVDERLIEMQVGETRELKATAIPLLASEQKRLSQNDAEAAALLSMLVTDKIQWTSSDAETATVDESGNVSALKEGSCKITVKSGEHEIVFNILVNVPIPEWASEEFLAYIERIGAYTELPLGTDGSAGPTAQYVTFGFETAPSEFHAEKDQTYHYTELGQIDERTQTTYKYNTYAKGMDDNWYSSWDSLCWDEALHGHTFKGAYCALKITPRKWRLLDKEKGLLVMERSLDFESYNTGFKQFTKCLVNTTGWSSVYRIDFNKEALEKIPFLCDYETSYLREICENILQPTTLDLYMFDNYFISTGKYDSRGNPIFKEDDDGYYFFVKTEAKKVTYLHSDYEISMPFFKLCKYFTERQLAQIKEVDLDCGEGGSVKGRCFPLSIDEIKKYYPKGSTLSTQHKIYYDHAHLHKGPSNIFENHDYNNYREQIHICYTRTRKKIDGKNTLCAVQITTDGTIKGFIQLDGYDTALQHYLIPAICVKPAP